MPSNANWRGRQGSRLCAAVGVATAVGLGAALPADASTVRIENFVITYVAAPGEKNQLGVDDADGSENFALLTDPGAHIHVGPGCQRRGAGVVCHAGSATLVADLKDQDDSLRIPSNNQGVPSDTCCSAPGSIFDVRAALGAGKDQLAVAVNEEVEAEAGPGNDFVSLWTNGSFVKAGAGDDLLWTSPNGLFGFSGEAGDDRMIAFQGGGVIDGGSGDDYMTGGGGQSGGEYTHVGGDGDDVIDFNCDDPLCFGDDPPFAANGSGGAGNDVFWAAARPDLSSFLGAPMSGGSGVDLVDYSGSSADLTISLDDQENDGSKDPALGGYDNVMSDIENVIGGTGNDSLVGSARANRLDGNPGNDDLTGAGGRDHLLGRDGNDTFRSQDGLVDVVSCGLGLDEVFGDPFDQVGADCEKR